METGDKLAHMQTDSTLYCNPSDFFGGIPSEDSF